MIEKIQLKRKFILDRKDGKVTLTDPDEDLSPDQVRKFYAGRYPELTNGSVQGPAYEGDYMVFTFKTTVGTKG